MSDHRLHAEGDPCAAFRDDFSALLDDELAPARRAEVEAHLAGCADCLRQLDAMKRISSLYAALPPVSAPHDFEARVRAAALRPHAPVPARGRRVFAFVALAAAAGFALLSLPPLLRQNAAHREQDLARNLATSGETKVRVAAPEVAAAPAPQAAPAPMAAPAEETSDTASALMNSAPAAAPVAAAEPAAAPQPPATAATMADADNASASLSYEASPQADHAKVEQPGQGMAEDGSAPAPERARVADTSPSPPAVAMRKSAPSADAPRAGAPPAAAPDAAETWHAAGRDFVLEEDHWVEVGERGQAAPKALTHTAREFQRLLREFPNLKELRAATRPVVFRVGEQWYELKPQSP